MTPLTRGPLPADSPAVVIIFVQAQAVLDGASNAGIERMPT
jgi:hypothetical protein